MTEELNEIEEIDEVQEEEEVKTYDFPEGTVFYQDLIEKEGYKWLAGVVTRPETADKYGILDNNINMSELVQKNGRLYLKGYEAPDPELAELKARKLAELSNITDKFEQNRCSEMYFTSSLGFRVNGDRRSVQNIESLITIGEPTRFKDYDNKLHPDFSVPVPDFSVEKLNILKLEIAKNGENLYQQKFLYEYRIQTATTPEELNFDMVFEMSDFSA